MNNMPGFAAEASLYASEVHYRSMVAGMRGEAATILPAQFNCVDHEECSACIPMGPSIFTPGRQFCQSSRCRPTASGGCRCTVYKGWRSCNPAVPDVLVGF
jgi:hypothetical protein